MKNFSLQLRGTLLVALSGLLYGFMGFFGTHLIQENLSVSNMLFWRFFIATIWVLGTAFWYKRNFFKKLPDKRILLRTLLLGAVSYSGGSFFFFLASQYTGTGVAMVIFFCFPVFVTLFTWMTTSWKMNKYAAASLFTILLGLFLLKGHGTHTLNLVGILLAVISGVSYAIYVISSKHNTKNFDSELLTFLVCLGNSIIFLIVSIATKHFSIPTTLHAWIYISAIGVVATALPIQLLLDGIKHVSPVKASILSVLEPVVTLLVGVLLLHESMSSLQALGVLTILLGALVIQFERAST
jgi:drug/metabolite transporter (DMT)-like permease